jgi:hypothetical protein
MITASKQQKSFSNKEDRNVEETISAGLMLLVFAGLALARRR